MMLEADDEDGARNPYYIRTSAATSDIPRLVVKCEGAPKSAMIPSG